MVFLDVILSILIFFQIVIQKSDCYRVLAQVCIMRDIGDLEEQAKVTLPIGNHRTLSKRDKK